MNEQETAQKLDQFILDSLSQLLPRGYISYSQYIMWKRNKEGYRKRYYLDEPSFETAETRFGKKIAELLQSDDPSVRHIPNYASREHDMDVMIEGTRVIGRLDGFSEEKLRFLDHKSSHVDKDGKPPWNKIKVRQLEQLPFYSMLVKEQYGKVDNVCHLIWIETEFKENTVQFDGHTLKAKGRELCLTGRVKKFRRVIREFERKRIKEDLLKVIKEIQDDYTKYKSTRSN